jgi:tetratricopeptide (TPR) repeat protein
MNHLKGSIFFSFVLIVVTILLTGFSSGTSLIGRFYSNNAGLLIVREAFSLGIDQKLSKAAYNSQVILEALGYYEQALKFNPSSATASKGRANALWMIGREDKAVEEWERLVETGAANPIEKLALGMAYEKDGETSKAVTILESAGFSASSLLQAGWYARKYGDREASLAYVSLAVELEPESALIHEMAATEYEYWNLNSRASQEWLQVARSTNKDDPHYWLAIAQAQRLQGNMDNAKDAYEIAILKIEKHVIRKPESLELYLMVGDIFEEDLKNYASAQDWYGRAAVFAPNDPELKFRLGRVAFRLGDNEGALRYLDEAEELGYKKPELWYFLGHSYYKLGSMNKAIESMLQFVELKVCPWWGYGDLGKWYEEEGDLDRALSAYQNAVRCNPEFESGRQKIRELSKPLRQ